MFAERIYIHQKTTDGTLGALIVDPDRLAERAVDLRFTGQWPKGYDVCTFKVVVKDIFDWIPIKIAQTVLIMDGDVIVYDGRVYDIQRSADREASFVVSCTGWIVLFNERLLWARWIDNAATRHLQWPDDRLKSNVQNSFVGGENRDSNLRVLFGTRDIVRTDSQYYSEEYKLPPLQTVRQVIYDWAARSGEGVVFKTWNTDQVAVEDVLTVVADPQDEGNNRTVTFTEGDTRTFEFRFYPNVSDTYDQHDYGIVTNVRVRANYQPTHPDVADPAYTSGEIVIDIILLTNAAYVSGDFDGIGEPGRVLNPYTVEEPTKTIQVIEEIASYSDTSYNTWGFSVWSRSGTTDGKPKCEFKYRDVSDWEYEVQASDQEVAGLRYSANNDVVNAAMVEYTDERQAVRTITPTDDADYIDQDSADAYYRRDHFIRAGKASATTAKWLATRYLSYHSEGVTQGSVTVVDRIKTKGNYYVPANRVRAGQRVKLLNTGEVFFIRSTSYDAETRKLTISPDVPEDNIDSFFAWKRRVEQIQRDRDKAASRRGRLG